MKRTTIILSILLLTVLAFGLQPALAQNNTWTAEYFNNPSLAGAPVFVQTENWPSHNWGYGSPHPAVPADYFSARWTTTAYLNAGSYLLTVRADDGFRVIVNGVVQLNQWGSATGQTYQATLNLNAGNHTFVIEYFEAQEVAFIEYHFQQVSQPGPQPPGGITATVTAHSLNVRNAPNAWAQILTRIYQGQSYAALGRNADTSWLQLNVNGTIGWVNRSYVSGSGFGSLPVTDGGVQPPPPPPAGAVATVTAYALNVRNIPNPFTGSILTRISRGQAYPVIGRNADTSWLQLNVSGTVGWVNSSYVSATNLHLVPITDSSTSPTPPVGSQATVRAYFLNVRNAPNAWANVLTIISRGQTYPVVGRNADASWVQLNVNGTLGWVNRGWVSVTNLNVPITG